MDPATLRDFLMWCTIINGGLLLFWTTMMMIAPDLVYRTQHRWFPLPRESFTVVMCSFLALFKLQFLALNLIPYLALLIVG